MSAPSTNTYLLQTADPANLPNALALTANHQLALTQSGTDYVLAPTDTLLSIATANRSGLLGYDNIAKAVLPVQITSNLGTISVTNPFGISGASSLNLEAAPSTSVQLVKVTENGTSPAISTQSTLNFINGAGVTIEVVNNVGQHSADITINASAGSGTVSSVGATSTTGLTFGVDKPTTTPVVRFNLPGPGGGVITEGSLLVGSNTGTYAGLVLGAAGEVLTSHAGTASWQPAPSSVVNLTSNTGLVVGGTGTNTLTVDFPKPVAEGNLLVGNGTGEYANLAIGAVNKFAISNGTTVTWGPSNDPVDGYVVGLSGGDIQWIPNTQNVLPSGWVVLNTKDGSFGNAPYTFVPDGAVEATTVVLAGAGIQAGGDVDEIATSAYVFCTLTGPNPLLPGNTHGYYIVNGGGAAAVVGESAAYAVIKY